MKKVFLKVFAVVVLGCSIASMCSGAAAENSIKRNANRAAMNWYAFQLYVGTDDDNAMTDPALRDEDLTQETYANAGFTKLQNAANSLNFRVYKVNPVNGAMHLATNSCAITSNSTTQIQMNYTSQYLTTQGWFAMYGWTTKNDCVAEGYWAP